MTYQEKFEALRDAFKQAGEKYLSAEKEFSSILGWGDSEELNQLLNAKRKFEEAENNYHDFIAHIQKNTVLPDQPFRPESINKTP